jgi:hypothetical protein
MGQRFDRNLRIRNQRVLNGRKSKRVASISPSNSGASYEIRVG